MILANIEVDTDRLPKIPKVVQQLIQSLNNEDLALSEIAAIASQDQVIIAKVIRVANSPLFGGSRTISSANDAVVRLGINTVRSIGLASGFVQAFKSPADFDIKAFWKNSFRIATIAKWIASLCRSDAEQAFCCGMMNGIGILAIHLLYPDKASEIETLVCHGGNRQHLEFSTLGFTHDEMSAALVEHWLFPPQFQQALLAQSTPLDATPPNVLALILFLATTIEDCLQLQQDNQAISEALSVPALSALKVDYHALLDGLDQLRERVEASTVFIE